jgi:hypothetical protein
MRVLGVRASATTLAAAVIAASGLPWLARANEDEVPPLNGTYLATSNGVWAQANDSYQYEATVRSTWTISSTCSDAQNCTGRVTSDQGWSAEIYTHSIGMWYVKRDVPNWEPCSDGTAAPGQQTYYFYPVDSNGQLEPTSTTLMAGKDETIGLGGACGINKPLVIQMPFRLDKSA